jgi:hypothetical protein
MPRLFFIAQSFRDEIGITKKRQELFALAREKECDRN